MLTDSGVNAMSDKQLAAMMESDDSYAGSATFTKLENKIRDIFGMDYFLPVHQGRAAENVLAKIFVRPGQVVPMNYHFTTPRRISASTAARSRKSSSTRAWRSPAQSVQGQYGHRQAGGGDRQARGGKHRLRSRGDRHQPDRGQPHSLENLRQVSNVCNKHGILLVFDASLLADNLYFIRTREEACKQMSVREITRAIADLCDIVYFSARKLGCARGGGICTRSRDLFMKMRELVTLYEGFLTYGGMSVREIEAITVGLEETMDDDMISQGPQFIKFMVDELDRKGVPVITPPGGSAAISTPCGSVCWRW